MRRGLRCLVLLVLLSALPAWSAEASLRIEGAARQGGALFVTVEGMEAGSLEWLGQTWPLAPDGGRLRAVVPVPIDTKPGEYLMAVAGGPSKSVKVALVRYPHQSISLPPDMLAGYDKPRNKADDKLLIDASKVFTPQRLWHGAFLQPARGPLSTRYGLKRTYNGWRKGWHKGQDIEAGTGTPIVAPAAAVVALVAPGQLVNGNATLLNHGMGVYSLYMHQSRIRVKKEQAVARGERVGDVGASGAGTGPHLHWQVFVHGVPVDPVVFSRPPAGW